ncbi:MAG: hypothetical protein ABDH32_01835 [Candidatus Caldarchaeales archaeon]
MILKSPPQILFYIYISLVAFTSYWSIRLIFGGVPVSNVWVGFLFCIPWIIFSFMEKRKYTIHYLFAIVYSTFLLLQSLVGLEEDVFLRSWGEPPIEILGDNLDGIIYIGLLSISGYLSYRRVLIAPPNISLFTKMVVAILYVFIGVLYSIAIELACIVVYMKCVTYHHLRSYSYQSESIIHIQRF